MINNKIIVIVKYKNISLLITNIAPITPILASISDIVPINLLNISERPSASLPNLSINTPEPVLSSSSTSSFNISFETFICILTNVVL